MRITFEPDDIQAIADAVAKKLAPLIAKVQEAVERLESRKTTSVLIKQPEAVCTTTPKSEVIRRKELCLITGLSSTTLWRLEREGVFPARIRLTNNRVGWRRSEVEEWLASRMVVS